MNSSSYAMGPPYPKIVRGKLQLFLGGKLKKHCHSATHTLGIGVPNRLRRTIHVMSLAGRYARWIIEGKAMTTYFAEIGRLKLTAKIAGLILATLAITSAAGFLI